MASRLRKNIGFQSLYQFVVTFTPLITAPYLARVLGASQQGVYSYTLSIASYFLLFAMLGYANHGTRCVAKAGNDIHQRSKAFFGVYVLQVTTSIVALLVYILYMILFCRENLLIAKLQGITILACIFDINWFFAGIENFKTIALRNIIIKSITVSLILLLVKSEKDLWIYTLIMAISTLVSNFIVWPLLGGKIIPHKISKDDILRNIKPVLLLFIPLLAMSIYHYLDKTMLGMMSDYTNSGYYYNADKVINIPLGIITAISTVMFPRIIATLKEDKDKFEILFSKTFEGVTVAAIAFSFGIAAIAKEFVPAFFGTGFDNCIVLIVFLSPVMIIKSTSTVIRYQYLIPNGMDKGFIISVIIGAIVDLVANYLLIPTFGALGAVWGTLMAEFASCVYQFYYIKDKINVIRLLKTTIPYYVIGICMLAIVRLIPAVLSASNITLVVLEILIGAIAYALFSFVYWLRFRQKTIIDIIIPSSIKKRFTEKIK